MRKNRKKSEGEIKIFLAGMAIVLRDMSRELTKIYDGMFTEERGNANK